MSYRYTLKIGNDTYILDSLINSANTTIKTPLCSTELKSASGSLTFSLIGARDRSFYATIMQAILTARDNTSMFDTEITLAEINDSTSAVVKYLFRGYLDNNNFTLTTKILPENVTLTFKDKTTLLDTKVRFNRVYEGQTRKYILEKLLEDLTTDTGITATLLSFPSYLNDTSSNSKYKVSNWCVAEEDGNTYREKIDTLLYEAPGCVLYYDHNSNGYKVAQLPTNVINNYSSSHTYKVGDLCRYNSKLYSCIIAITTGHAWRSSEWEEVRGINYLSHSSSLQTSAGVYKYDGLLLKYPTISTRQNQNLYAENITTGLDSEGNITGLDVVANGYFPENGDITATYQQYSDEGLDRAYITKESRKQNEDISLLYAKECSYVISQHPLDACAIVTTPLPNIGWTGSAQYYPKKAWVLLQNTSGITATITGFSVQGTAVYKSKMNKLTVPSACSNPEEYETETIFENTSNSDSLAKEFAQWMFNAKKYGCSTSNWEETDTRLDATISKLGDVVNVIHKETGVAIPHIVVQIDAVGLLQHGIQRKYKVTAVSISNYSTYQSKKISNIPSIGTPANATKILISAKEFALGSSSIIAPTTGWTSDRSSLTPTIESPYIWAREVMTYGDGSTVTNVPYVLEVYTTSEVQQFSFTVSPYYVIKDFRRVGAQYLALVANVSGYSEYQINYKVNNSFICSIYEKATTEIEDESYYTFAQTTDQTAQPNKTYYTRSGTSPNWIYTECVNLEQFVGSYTNYYEITEVSYASGVFHCTFDAHAEVVTYGIPYINAFSDTITIEMYNGSVYVQEVKLSVNDETEYNKCAGVIQTDTQSMPQTISGQSLVVGDFVVFAVDKTAWNPNYTAGAFAYINNAGQWTIAQPNEKAEEKLIALQKLTELGVDLTTLNNTSVIKWFSDIVASNITADYIGSKKIKILDKGAIYGGAYKYDPQTKEIKPDLDIPEANRVGFYINSEGRIEAINANFRRLTVEKDSIIKGRLECGNENDIMIKTVFTTDTTEGKQYLASHTTTADGFSWSEAHNYISTRVDTPSATQWNVVGADESTLQNLTVKSASGTVNGNTVSKVVYTTTPIATNRIYASQGVNTGGETQNKTTSFTNCMPVPISLNYNFHQGYAFWFAVFSWGAEYPSCQYTITHTDSTTTTVVLCQNATSRSQSDFIDTITLLSGETITWSFGHIGAPAASWNNGVESSTLELTWSLGLSTGFTFYNNGVASVMPMTGYYDLTASDNGLLNLQIPTGTNIISLPHTSAAWSYTGVNKYFKFMHSFNGSSTINAVLYSSFTRCDSLYIQDRYGNIHGVSTTPSTSLLNTISISSGEFAFSYNGVSYSQIAYDPNHPSANTVEYWVRDYSVSITVPSTIKGIYTASIYPRDANSDLGATGSGKYRALHVVTANADVVNAGTTNATALVTSDISSSSNIQISTIVPKTSTANIGTSSNQFNEVRATKLYENNSRVFSTGQIVQSSSYNLTAISVGQIGIYTGLAEIYQYNSNYRARVTLPSGGTYAYSFVGAGNSDAYRNAGYSSSTAGGTQVTLSTGNASSSSNKMAVQFTYWRIS